MQRRTWIFLVVTNRLTDSTGVDDQSEPRIQENHHREGCKSDVEHGFVSTENTKHHVDVHLNGTQETEHDLVVREEDQIVSRMVRLGSIDDPVVDQKSQGHDGQHAAADVAKDHEDLELLSVHSAGLIVQSKLEIT